MAGVYLLHLSPALSQSKHYCGSSPTSVKKRIAQHKAGQGARMTQVAVSKGIMLRVAKVWELDTPHDARVLERCLKNTHNLKQYCPICSRGKVKEVCK
jgi:putative endonuclease